MDAASLGRRYLAALSAGDVGGVLACVSADFHNEHTSALGRSSHGRTEYERRLPGFFAEFGDLTYEIIETSTESSSGPGTTGRATVAIRYRMTAVVDGHFVDVPGVMWFVVDDGEIVRRTDFWDSLTFLKQVDRQ